MNKPRADIKDNYNFSIKSLRKVVSIFVVTFLITALFTSVTSAQAQDSDYESPLKKFLEATNLKERVQSVKDTLFSKLGKLKSSLFDSEEEPFEDNNDPQSPTRKVAGGSILESVKSFFELRSAATGLVIHTIYKGHSEDEELKLFRKITMDVSGDDVPDIEVKMKLRPRLERPLKLAICFDLTITRLNEFPIIEADFQAYTELRFPGIFNAEQKGDTIRFGYHSPDGEEVPDSCVVTYKYLPHIVYFVRPEHIAELNPGSAKGNADLSLILGYINMDGETVKSELISRTEFNPAADAKMHIWGDGILGGRTFNFEKTAEQPTQTDFYCSFTNDSSNIIAYAKDLPNKVTFTIDQGTSGHVEFDTYGAPASEIGLCDSLTNPVNKIYFADLPSKARLEWNADLIMTQKANINFYTEGEGISLNAHLEGSRGGTFDFSLLSNENLDGSVDIDTAEGYMIIQRTEVDLTLGLALSGSAGGTLDLSFNLSRTFANPFELYFDLDQKIEVTFSNQSFEVSDFYMYIQNSTMNFGIKADRIVKNQQGNMSIVLGVTRDGEDVILNFSVYIDSGVSILIYGLKLGFNGEWRDSKWGDPLEISTSSSFEIDFKFYDLKYYIAEDWSWGYVYFRGGLSFETYRTFTILGKEAGLRGKVFAGTDAEDGLNLSWYTDTSKGYNLTKLNITGLTFGLENFHFYIGDVLNFSVSELKGSIKLTEACNESGSASMEIIGNHSNLDFNLYFNIDISSIALALIVDQFHVDLEDAAVFFKTEWNDSTILYINFEAEADVNLTINDMDLLMGSSNETNDPNGEPKKPEMEPVIDTLSGYITGHMGLHVNITLPLDYQLSNGTIQFNLSDQIFGILLIDTKIRLSIENLSLLGYVAFFLESTGKSTIYILNISVYPDPDPFWEGVTWIRPRFSVVTEPNGLFYCELLLVSTVPIIGTLKIENATITGNSEIFLNFAFITTETGTYPMFVGGGVFNNENTNLQFDNFYLAFPMVGGLVLPLRFFSADFSEGEWSLLVRAMGFIRVEMIGTGVNNVGIELKISEGFLGLMEDDAFLTFEFHGPFEYICFDLWQGNLDETGNASFLLDTKGNTEFLDAYVIFSKEFINNIVGPILEDIGIPFTPVENDFGLRMNDLILTADAWKFNDLFDPLNWTMEGYLHVVSGELLILREGEWEPIIPDVDFTITVYPGLIQVNFHVAVEDQPIQFNGTVGDVEINLSGLFSSAGGSLTVMWDRDGSIFDIDANIGGSITIKDFSFKAVGVNNSSIDAKWDKIMANGYLGLGATIDLDGDPIDISPPFYLTIGASTSIQNFTLGLNIESNLTFNVSCVLLEGGGLLKINPNFDVGETEFIHISGTFNITEFFVRISGPENAAAFVIPNAMECKNTIIEISRQNKTDDYQLMASGAFMIYPGESEEFGFVGLGIMAGNKTSGIFLTLESLYFNVIIGPGQTPGSDPYDPMLHGDIFFIMDPNTGRTRIYSENDSISFSFEKFAIEIRLNGFMIGTSVDSFLWNRVGNLDLFFEIDGEITTDPGGQITPNIDGGKFSIKHHAYAESLVRIRNMAINIGDMDKPTQLILVKWWNRTRSIQKDEIYTIEFKTNQYVNLSADMNANVTCVLEIGGIFGSNLVGTIEFTNHIASNLTLHIKPFAEKHAELIVHEPGINVLIQFKYIGALGAYCGFKLGPMSLTAGKLVLTYDRFSNGPFNSGGWLQIDNQGVEGEGQILEIEFTRDISIVFGTFWIDHGTFNVSWNLTDDVETRFVKFDNDGMYPSIGLMKIKTDRMLVDLLNFTVLEFGETYMEFGRDPDTSDPFVYVDNTAEIELSIVKLLLDFNFSVFSKVGTESKITLTPGEFRITGESLSSGDFDYQATINNGIFDAQILALLITVKSDEDMEISIDKRDFTLADYDNTITVKLRLRGTPGCLDNAIYINTEKYIEMDRVNLTIYKNRWKVFEISTMINIEFKFDQWVVGFMDGNFTHDGNIIPQIDFDILEVLFKILRWKETSNNNGYYQELSAGFKLSDQIIGMNLDTTNFDENLQHEWVGFNLGNLRFTLSSMINANKNLDFQMDYNLEPAPGETVGHFYVYIDTNNEPLIDNLLSFKIVNSVTNRGINITASAFTADEFNFSCDSKYSILGWVPDWETKNIDGELSGLDISIGVKFKNTDWIEIFNSNNLIVLIEGGSTQAQAGQSVQFQVYVWGGTAPYTCVWTFPSGTSDQSAPVYTFDLPGTYMVSVEVIDDVGVTGSASTVVLVTEQFGDFGNGPL